MYVLHACHLTKKNLEASLMQSKTKNIKLRFSTAQRVFISFYTKIL